MASFLKECVEKTVNVSLTVLTLSREFCIPTFTINRLLEANVGIGVAFQFIDQALIEPDIEVKETNMTNQSKPYEPVRGELLIYRHFLRLHPSRYFI